MEALGHGSTAYLLTQAQQQLQPVSALSVLSAAALAADGSAHSKGSCHYVSQGSLSEDACRCLVKAPLLAELQEWTSWRLLFEADLGSLSDFVAQKGMCHAMLCRGRWQIVLCAELFCGMWLFSTLFVHPAGHAIIMLFQSHTTAASL